MYFCVIKVLNTNNNNNSEARGDAMGHLHPQANAAKH